MLTNILLLFLIFLILSIIGCGIYIYIKYVKPFFNDNSAKKMKKNVLSEMEELNRIIDKMF
jgi:Na+-transporting methylmalonyl-CoA/oxaloacetate decarboxylase gamma subunit